MLKLAIKQLIAITLVSVTTTSFAQGKLGEVGKFLKCEHADILFGKVVESIPISTNELEEAVSNAKDYILFSFKNGKVNITSEKRKSLTRSSYNADVKEQMFFYSKNILTTLLRYANGKELRFERRSTNVYSISVLKTNRLNSKDTNSSVDLKSGSIRSTTAINNAEAEITLEFATACPPICFD